jgi:hypothetical protein
VDNTLSIADLKDTGVIALTVICDLAQEGSRDAEDALLKVAGTLLEALNSSET